MWVRAIPVAVQGARTITARSGLVLLAEAMLVRSIWAIAGWGVGFSLWAMKAVLNGQCNEVIDLARTNLLR